MEFLIVDYNFYTKELFIQSNNFNKLKLHVLGIFQVSLVSKQDLNLNLLSNNTILLVRTSMNLVIFKKITMETSGVKTIKVQIIFLTIQKLNYNYMYSKLVFNGKFVITKLVTNIKGIRTEAIL
jgi:hypothetical protein